MSSLTPPPLELFVYGTLKRGGRYHDRFCRGVLAVEAASVRGRVYTLPAGYPVLVVPRESVIAEGSSDPLADAAVQTAAAKRAARAWPGPGEEIRGELFAFADPQTRLPAIDELEDFRAGAPSLYRRVLLPARRQPSGALVAAWAYVEDDRINRIMRIMQAQARSRR